MLSLVARSFPASPEAWLDLLVIMSLKATLLLVVIAVLTLLLARASAAARHLMWSVGMLGLLVLAPLALVGPGFQVVGLGLPKGFESIGGSRLQMASVDAGEEEAARLDAAPEGAIANEPASEAQAGAAGSAKAADAALPGEKASSHDATLTGWILGLWLLGSGAMMAWLAAGLVVLARLSRSASPVRDRRMNAVFQRCRLDLGLRSAVELSSSERTPVPCTWGLLRPRVLVPAVAFDWPVERVRAVLLHELAHVARRDCLTQTLAHLACAIFWFNPLAWYGARRMRIERERACDDRVLHCGTDATDYADHLLAVVRAMRGHGLGLPGTVAFARPSQLEGRLLAVLDPHRVRGVFPAARVWRVAALAAFVVLPLALLRPWTNPAQAGLSLTDHGRARPEDGAASELVTPPASETTLDRRLSWVTAQAAPRGSKGFWVAYSIPRRSPGHGGYLSDNGAVDLSTLNDRWTGPRLGDVLAGRSRKDPTLTFDESTLVLAYHFTGPGARPENIDRIRVQTLGLPADFGRQPLYWLGPVEDRESFDWARRVENGARTQSLRSTALEATAVHADDAAVRGHLQQVLRSQASSAVRSTAAEMLHRFTDPGTLQLLKSTARNDRSSLVRHSAVEALGQMGSKESVKLLSEMARDPNESAEIRRAALEALGEEASAEAAETLEALATPGSTKTSVTIQEKSDRQSIKVHSGEAKEQRETDEEDIQREAVESLGNLPSETSLPKLVRIARTHPNQAVRREALETIGELGTPKALDALVEIAWDKKESELAAAAVEAMGSYDEAAPKLIEIARRHSLVDVRRRAVESMGDLDPEPKVVAALDDLARNDPSQEIQLRAVESIAQLPEELSLPRLEKIARTHPEVAVRRRAIEGIAELDPDKAAPILESLINPGKKGS